MSTLIQEAAIDDQFNTETKKIQAAITRLSALLDIMTSPSSTHRPVESQRIQLRHAKDDIAKLLVKAK